MKRKNNFIKNKVHIIHVVAQIIVNLLKLVLFK